MICVIDKYQLKRECSECGRGMKFVAKCEKYSINGNSLKKLNQENGMENTNSKSKSFCSYIPCPNNSNHEIDEENEFCPYCKGTDCQITEYWYEIYQSIKEFGSLDKVWKEEVIKGWEKMFSLDYWEENQYGDEYAEGRLLKQLIMHKESVFGELEKIVMLIDSIDIGKEEEKTIVQKFGVGEGLENCIGKIWMWLDAGNDESNKTAREIMKDYIQKKNVKIRKILKKLKRINEECFKKIRESGKEYPVLSSSNLDNVVKLFTELQTLPIHKDLKENEEKEIQEEGEEENEKGGEEENDEET